MAGRSSFTLVLAISTACRVMPGGTISTSTVPVISTTVTNSSVSYSYWSSDSYSSTYNSYLYDPHPDYPDCNNNDYPPWYIGDGYCDTFLNNATCGWDGGDCCLCTCNTTTSHGCVTLHDDGRCEDPSAALYVGDGCQNTTYQVPQVINCPEDHISQVIRSTADATMLAETTLCSGGYFDVEWMGHIDINTTIHVLSGTRVNITGISNAVADGGGIVQIFLVSNGSLELNNMKITNGAGSEGGAIILAAGSELFTESVSFSSNTATKKGGAVFALFSRIELFSTTFNGNSARNGGAMFVHDSDVFGSGNTSFIGNSVSENGGALYITGDSHVGWNMRIVTIETIVNFTSHSNDTTYTTWTEIDDSGETAFLNNSAEGFGGAIYADDSEVSMAGTTLMELNKAWSGGAIYIENGAIVKSDGVTIFALNKAINDAGAIGANGDGGYLTVNGTTIFANNTSGGSGGAIDLSNINLVVDGNVTFSSNSAGSFGGALFASQQSKGPRLTGVTFSGNTAESGGAVFFWAVGGNSYYVSSGNYDGFVSYYGSIFEGCRFDSNSATSMGGAVFSIDGSSFLSNTKFEGNSAGIGGGMKVSGITYLFNSSFVDNRSGEGGGPAISYAGDILEMFGLDFLGNAYICPIDAFIDSETAGDIQYNAVCDGCDNIECENCKIEDGYSRLICSELLDHTDSRGGSARLETLVMEPGYWRATNTSKNILECFNMNACRGGVTGSSEYCLRGYGGPYCSVCSTGYGKKMSYGCKKCSEQDFIWPTLFVIAIGLLALLFLCYMVSIEGHNVSWRSFDRVKGVMPLQSFKIIIVSWQIVTQFSTVANVVYPRYYQELLEGLALLNFDFGWILSTACVVDIDFHAELIISTVSPLVAVALLGLTYMVALRRNYGSGRALRSVRRKHVNAITLVALLIYSSVSSVVFRAFACDSLDDGNVYLRSDCRIECNSPKHTAFQIYAGFMIALYPVGIPVFFAVLLFRKRKDLENAALRTYNGELVHQSISSLWKPYKPSVFYYEVVECARRAILAGVVVFIYPNTAAQIAVTLALAFIFAFVSERLDPYESKWDGSVSRMGHIMVVLTMFVALLTKVDVSDEGIQSQNIFAAILVAAHVAMVLTAVTEAFALIFSVRQHDSPLPKNRKGSVLPVEKFSTTQGYSAGREVED